MTDKTLQDIANKYHVNKPALYARLKKLESDNPNLKLQYKKGNLIYLTDTGLDLLEADLIGNPISSTKKTESDPELLHQYIQTLERQLEVKDQIIDKLLSVLAQSHRLTNQQQQLQAIDVYQKEKPTKAKKSFISKLVIAGKLFKGDYD